MTQTVIEEVVVYGKRTVPLISRITIPPLECPGVLLPTPANLVNYFKGLASFAYTNARDDLKEDAEEELKKIQKVADDIKEILETLKPIFDPYDPKFKKLEIQEIEWEIRIQGLVDEFSTYVQSQLLKIVSDLTSIEITVPILGIEVDVIKFVTDRTYLTTLLDEIDLDIDRLYDLLPPEYKLYKDKFDSLDFRKKSIRDYFNEKVKEFQTGQFILGLEDLGLGFTLPTDPRAAAKLAIQTIIADEKKDIEQQIEDLKAIKIGPFTIEQILGGEITEKVEISEFKRDRLIKKLLNFAQDYFAFLFKEVLSKITDAIKLIPGLDAIISLLTFDFCKFLTLIGVPKTIELPAGSGIEEVAAVIDIDKQLPNAFTVEEAG